MINFKRKVFTSQKAFFKFFYRITDSRKNALNTKNVVSVKV